MGGGGVLEVDKMQYPVRRWAVKTLQENNSTETLLIHHCLAEHFIPILLKFRFKKRRGHGKNSYERRAYESVDEGSLSYRLYIKIWREKGFGQ